MKTLILLLIIVFVGLPMCLFTQNTKADVETIQVSLDYEVLGDLEDITSPTRVVITLSETDLVTQKAVEVSVFLFASADSEKPLDESAGLVDTIENDMQITATVLGKVPGQAIMIRVTFIDDNGKTTVIEIGPTDIPDLSKNPQEDEDNGDISDVS